MAKLMSSVAEVRSFNPCDGGMNSLLEVLRANGFSETEEVPLTEIVGKVRINHILWLLGKRKTEISIAAAFARKCADSVAHLKTNKAAANAAAAAAAHAAAYAAADAAHAAAYAKAAAAAAAAYAADAYAAAHAAAYAKAAYAAAAAAAAAAAYAADAYAAAADAAAYAADADAYAAAAADAAAAAAERAKQTKVLLECIEDYERSN
jgi:hypothetical protein